MAFVKLPIAFLTIGNHGDISKVLQELITQIETLVQQQVNIQPILIHLIKLFLFNNTHIFSRNIYLNKVINEIHM